MRKPRAADQPLCFWGGEEVQRVRVHFLTPDPSLPPGTMRRVCSPACPARPQGSSCTSYEPNWWRH